MLYHLTRFADAFQPFNLFVYISFRAAGATVTAFFLAVLLGPPIIRLLHARGVGEVIRADGPSSHQTKRGTPTMGGLIILACTLLPTLLWARLDNRLVLVAFVATLWAGLIGFLDDYLKVVEGKSRGLVARYKLAGQVTFGVALGLFLLAIPVPGSLAANETTLPFLAYGSLLLPPLIYIAFVTFIVTGSSNMVNLTDGLDGLAAGLTAIAAAAFAVFAYVFGHVRMAEYLLVYYIPGSGELSVFCASLMGAAMGFLWYNAHPADVFMGDTGSLAIGGALGTVAILIKAEFLLLLIGGVFVAETPLHHHFEKLGWAESKIVFRFYIVGIICALAALATLKVR